jgi:hypothetical protein
MIVGFRLLFYNVSYYSFGAEINFSCIERKSKCRWGYVDGIYVINLTTEKSVITCVEGYFGIKEGQGILCCCQRCSIKAGGLF